MEAEEAEAQPQPKMLLERVASQLERLARGRLLFAERDGADAAGGLPRL